MVTPGGKVAESRWENMTDIADSSVPNSTNQTGPSVTCGKLRAGLRNPSLAELQSSKPPDAIGGKGALGAPLHPWQRPAWLRYQGTACKRRLSLAGRHSRMQRRTAWLCGRGGRSRASDRCHHGRSRHPAQRRHQSPPPPPPGDAPADAAAARALSNKTQGLARQWPRASPAGAAASQGRDASQGCAAHPAMNVAGVPAVAVAPLAAPTMAVHPHLRPSCRCSVRGSNGCGCCIGHWS